MVLIIKDYAWMPREKPPLKTLHFSSYITIKHNKGTRQMGDKRMKKREKKSSPRKAAPGGRRDVKPESEHPILPITVREKDRRRREIIRVNKSGSGVVTKSWVVPSSSSCNLNQPPRKHSWPQLALIDIPPEIRTTNVPGKYSLKGFFHRRQAKLYSSDKFLWGRYYYNLWSPDYSLRSDSSVHFRRCLSSGGAQFVITGLTSPAFAFPKVVEEYWVDKFRYHRRWVSIMKNCTVIEPFSTTDHQYMEFTNLTGHQGKIYAISRQGSLAVIEYSESSTDYEITRLGKNRAVPSKACRHFREHLFEYKGGIFLVFLLSRASVDVVDDVEVFGLDESSLCWKKVEKLPDDTVFFVEDKCCLGVSASLFGCKSGENCVYFTYERAENWFCFNMKTSRISATEEPANGGQKDEEEREKIIPEKGCRRDVKPESEWPSLPITVGEKDWLRVNKSGSGVVTKSWVVQSSSSCNLNQPPRKHSWPQLALIDIPPEIQTTDVPGKYSLKGFFHRRQAKWYSSDKFLLGWDFFNRWSLDYSLRSDSSVHFRCCLNSGGTQFVITGLTSPAFAFCSKVERQYLSDGRIGTHYEWVMKNCKIVEPCSTTGHQYMEFTNLIGLGGKFYAISRQGSLVVIEDKDGFRNYEITLLGKNRAVPSKPCRHFREHLFEYKGGIFLVFLLSRASVNVVDDVEVFGLDESSLCWKKVEKLPDDTVFFVEDKCCLGGSASLLGCKRGNNCVHF
ncbi:hypothetical protein STAS_12220, partial [Striga asiatica]